MHVRDVYIHTYAHSYALCITMTTMVYDNNGDNDNANANNGINHNTGQRIYTMPSTGSCAVPCWYRY